MLLGSRLPGPAAGWRFVEKDLHDIARQVVEYDAKARLVREDGSGHLGLARYVDGDRFFLRPQWVLARKIHDLDTDNPLEREPDARVIRFMRSSDRRGRDMRRWREASKHADWMREKREFDEIDDLNGDHAERFMNAMKKDVSARPRAYIPRSIPKAS